MLERLLIVGLGNIGLRHARIAREMLPGARILVLRHRTCEEMPATVDACVTSLDEALQFQPQAAVVANPASHHLEVSLALARAGTHLLVEKPIGSVVDGVSALVNVCRSKNLTLMTGYNLRFLPSLEGLRELLQAARVGRVLSVRAEVGQYLPSWRPDSDYRTGVSARAVLGGGVLLELSHEIDYLRWLFGEVEWVSAVQRKQSDLEIDVEDTAHLVLGFAPVRGQVPVMASLDMDFVRHDATRTCTVIGETGTLRWDGLAGTVAVFEREAKAWHTLVERPVHRDETYLAEWRNFLDCIAGHGRPRVSGEAGLAVLRIVEAAQRSARSGIVARVEDTAESLETIAGAP